MEQPINLYPDLDENNTIKPKYSLRRRDVKGSRVYYADEQEHPIYNYSVTTIIDKVISKGIGFDRFMVRKGKGVGRNYNPFVMPLPRLGRKS